MASPEQTRTQPIDRRFPRPIDSGAMASIYDVLIVGAGPAGGAAAYHCAAAGLSTLLVDRKPFPRVKVCGDGLTPRALRALARMNHSIIEGGWPKIEGIRFVRGGESGDLLFAHEPPPFSFGAVVPRRVLDDRIRQAAAGAGAEFRDATSVTGLASDREGAVTGVWLAASEGQIFCPSRLTILADGAHGRLARKLQGNGATSQPYRGLAVRQYVEGVSELAPFFEVRPISASSGSLLEGYAWIFPVGPGVANVGLGVLNRRRPLEGGSLGALFSAFVHDLAQTDSRFARAVPVGPLEGGTLSTSMTDPFALPRGVLCVGDAAGLVNPFTGEGIAAALESGELAAQTAIRSLHASSGRLSGRPYARSLVRAYGRQWRLRASSRHLSWLLSLSPPTGQNQPRGRILPALRALALDETPAPRSGITPLVAMIDTATDSVVRDLRKRIAARLKQTDTVLAELGRILCSPGESPAIWPLIIAAQIANEPLQDPLVRRGFLALALSSLAASLLEEARDSAEAESENTLAIMVGDCFLTEATVVASRLPQASYRRVAAASLATSRALLTESLVPFGETPASRIRSASEAAASLVLDAAGDFSSSRAGLLRCVGWCAETVDLLFQYDARPNAGTAEQLLAHLAVKFASNVPLPLAAMERKLRVLARDTLGELAARDRSAYP